MASSPLPALKSGFNEEQYKFQIDDLDDWLECNPPTKFFSPFKSPGSSIGSRHEDNEQDGNGFSEQSIDADFNQVLTDDPFGQDKSCISPTSPTEVAELEAAHQYQIQDGLPLSRCYPSLSDEEVQSLLRIAMPCGIVPDIPIVGEVQSDYPQELKVQGPKARIQNKKQKSSPETEKTKRRTFGPNKNQKKSHNNIEKQYRDNLNQKITALRQSVPSIRESPKHKPEGDDACDIEDEPIYKYSKAVILTSAIEYISHLECNTERLSSETVVLKSQVIAFKKQLAGLCAIVLGNAPSLRSLITETSKAMQESELEGEVDGE